MAKTSCVVTFMPVANHLKNPLVNYNRPVGSNEEMLVMGNGTTCGGVYSIYAIDEYCFLPIRTRRSFYSVVDHANTLTIQHSMVVVRVAN